MEQDPSQDAPRDPGPPQRPPQERSVALPLAGLAVWAVGHAVAVYAAKRDPQFMAVLTRHLKHKAFLAC